MSRIEQICPNCGFRGRAKKFTRGSFFTELLLWLGFLIPGIVYSVWRLTSRYWGCPRCGAANMIPLDSPRGRKLLEELN